MDENDDTTEIWKINVSKNQKRNDNISIDIKFEMTNRVSSDFKIINANSLYFSQKKMPCPLCGSEDVVIAEEFEVDEDGYVAYSHNCEFEVNSVIEIAKEVYYLMLFEDYIENYLKDYEIHFVTEHTIGFAQLDPYLMYYVIDGKEVFHYDEVDKDMVEVCPFCNADQEIDSNDGYKMKCPTMTKKLNELIDLLRKKDISNKERKYLKETGSYKDYLKFYNNLIWKT